MNVFTLCMVEDRIPRRGCQVLGCACAVAPSVTSTANEECCDDGSLFRSLGNVGPSFMVVKVGGGERRDKGKQTVQIRILSPFEIGYIWQRCII